MPTFASLQTRQQTLIRKGLDASIFARPYSSTAPVTAITGTGGDLAALPTGYTDVGMLTKDDGATWTRNVDSSDTQSWGFSEPTRRDITGDVTGLQFTMQESKRLGFEMHQGLDLSAETYAATGELSWDKPSRPAMRYWQILAIAKDGDGADTIYFARWLPRASVTDMAEQTWQEGEEVQYGVTLTAYVDPVTGTSMREFWGGPALLGGLADDMGFTAAP